MYNLPQATQSFNFLQDHINIFNVSTFYTFSSQRIYRKHSFTLIFIFHYNFVHFYDFNGNILYTISNVITRPPRHINVTKPRYAEN